MSSINMRLWLSSWLLLMFFGGSLITSNAAPSSFSFEDNFDIMWAEDHFKTSDDGQVWHLSLDKETGCGFQTKQRYRFGWFSMKLKLVSGDSAGVVTAYYMCSDLDAAPKRDELDFEFLGNRTGEPYTIQTNVYKSGVESRSEYTKTTADQTTSSPTKNPCTCSLATRGGLEKTDWKKAPFVSSYKDFNADACQWKDPYPACVSTTTENWWDQYDAWNLSDSQEEDFSWVERNLVIYDYCKDTERFPTLPEECALRA
ncbi:uncharacterized protein A4U43_C07F38890 [Asparagus officinalis]|uniref:Xyloglucan endotransglucosylase/hydrolase n=1 Tax=Asparagus officinalis TaxID=4686 RepID=A0A5P1EIL1_ASPOF|nr:uncharacterized protein A4U43_C07F38890 [Asparagus officinalis]